MELDELQRHYGVLSDIYDRFLNAEAELSYATNKKNRAKPERDISSTMTMFHNYVSRHNSLYNLLTGGESKNITGTSRAYAYDEFNSRGFTREMARFMPALKRMIEEKKKNGNEQ